MLATFKDLSPYLRRYRMSFVLGALFLVVSSFFTTLAPRLVGAAIDSFNLGTMTLSRALLFALGVVAVVAVAATAMVLVRRTILNASWEIQFDIRRDLFKHFTRLDSDFYDNNRVGDLMARLTADLNAVRMLIGVGIFQGVNTALLLGFTLAQMVSLNVSLTLLTLAIVPFITVSFFLLLRIIHRRYEKVQQQFGNISAMAQENFSGIRVVKGFGIESRELERFKALNDEFIRRNLALTKVDGPLFPLMEVLFGLTISALLLVGGRFVLGIGESLSIGEFVAFILLFEGIQWPLIALGWIANIAQRGTTSWGRLKEILATEPRIKDGPQTDDSLREVKGRIEFRNVTLEFGGFKALDNVSFTVERGERVGITGRTGSGKSMIVGLVARLLEPTSGEILIDGIDIRRYPLEVLRRHIGVVPQEPFLFSDTLLENIAFGIPPQDKAQLEQKVREVARLVQLADDVEDFPQGYETRLGERGVTLSGGQRQRTAMARAIIRDPAILILDDALSAVDTQTEANILQGLERIAKNRTTLIVAHRVSAFSNVERILVLEQGRIVEEGSHQELVARGGYYADIDRRQQLEASLEAA